MCIGGAVLGRNKPVMKSVHEWMRINGHHVSPHNCEITSHGLRSIDQRILSSSDTTKSVIEFLFKHKDVHGVSHPSLKSHSTNHLAKKYFKQDFIPSTFTFKVKGSRKDVLRILSTCKILEHKTSFGARMSRTDPWPVETKDGFTIVRLSIGYEDTSERIIEGLNEILKRLSL
ncbi:metZ [Acrasis kona]|uniref:MetZ n=1 Tax=Acrasis kona TaxID=1008807 RepID=A0AAW2YHV1_9EUKA